MVRKTLILKLFYDDKHTASEIAKQLNVSNAYITKFINTKMYKFEKTEIYIN